MAHSKEWSISSVKRNMEYLSDQTRSSTSQARAWQHQPGLEVASQRLPQLNHSPIRHQVRSRQRDDFHQTPTRGWAAGAWTAVVGGAAMGREGEHSLSTLTTAAHGYIVVFCWWQYLLHFRLIIIIHVWFFFSLFVLVEKVCSMCIQFTDIIALF